MGRIMDGTDMFFEEMVTKGWLKVVGQRQGEPLYGVTELGVVMVDDKARRKMLAKMLLEEGTMDEKTWIAKACDAGMFEETVREDIEWLASHGIIRTSRVQPGASP